MIGHWNIAHAPNDDDPTPMHICVALVAFVRLKYDKVI